MYDSTEPLLRSIPHFSQPHRAQAHSHGRLPAAAAPAPAPTTITTLSDDILREIFLRLPDITGLARAAFACRVFLRAVRSSPAFRRRFRELRAPPLLALFLPPYMRAIVPADARKGSGVAADLNRLLQDSDSSESEWQSDPEISYYNGYAEFFNRATDQCASYSLHSQALDIYPKNLRDGNGAFLEFHMLSPDGEEQQPSRVVCVHHDRTWARARVAVFSPHTMEWQVVLPEMDTGGCWLRMTDALARLSMASSVGYTSGRDSSSRSTLRNFSSLGWNCCHP
ncbi:uncharacterized protein [Miscanthus floridulus]|uniref:uncharacterized protein n=1 Tax=Miscanthus floridulus TaxID=154761 RepID=UPI00345AEDCD